MAWLSQFKLGPPAYESLFDLNPGRIEWPTTPLRDIAPGGDGSMNATTSSRDRPVIRVAGNYITDALRNKLGSLAMIDDTVLVFEAMSGSTGVMREVWQERIIPTSTTAIAIPPNSYVRGSQLRAAAGGAVMLTPVGIWTGRTADSREGAGVNYWIGTPTYSETFEAFAADTDINGVGSWVKIVGAGTATIKSAAAAAFSGTRSARAYKTAAGLNPRYRRLTTFAADYTLNWKMLFPTGATRTRLGAWKADTLGLTDNSWEVEFEASGAQTKVNVFTGNVSTPVSSYFFTGFGSPQGLSVRVVSTTFTVFLGGTQIHTGTLSQTGPDRIILLSDGSPSANPLGGWDDLALYSASGTGTYAAATGVITPAQTLPDLSPVYVTYQSTGMAALLRGMPGHAEAGWVDFWRYGDLEILGA